MSVNIVDDDDDDATPIFPCGKILAGAHKKILAISEKPIATASIRKTCNDVIMTDTSLG
jgi:hypothetical protein